MPIIINLDTSPHFSFRQTVYGHGWSQLLPFKIDRENLRLNYVFGNLEKELPRAAAIFEDDGKIKIEIQGEELRAENIEKIRRAARHILRLDDDLQEFYRIVGANKEFVWIAEQRAGRLLRSPTVFEDLVKTICTTNCSWALTKKMTANLVEKLGEASASGERAFPTAEQMASVPAEFYRDEIRAGYRSAYFAELAEAVAGGKINPESWLNQDLPTRDLKKQMKQIKGVGDYAAENLLKLVGRYDGLALDSWLRAKFYQKRNAGTICADKQIEEFYSRFENWRGLAIWFDMSEK